MSEDILFFLLNGKAQMTEPGWMKFLETLIPVLPLLQCLAHPMSSLGKSITKMLNPDYSSSFKLPYIEVISTLLQLNNYYNLDRIVISLYVCL